MLHNKAIIFYDFALFYYFFFSYNFIRTDGVANFCKLTKSYLKNY